MNVAMERTFTSRVRRDEPMSRHTSWHVGGPAELFFTPADREDLAAFLRRLAAGGPIHFERVGETSVRAEAGLTCARIARQCIKWGLGPAEFFAGIPGTLGGALAMNAGAFGGETWRHVESVLTIDRAGDTHRRTPSEYRIGYREVVAPQPDEWFLEAQLSFERGAGTHAEEVRKLLERRRASQPIGEWSCGSVFTNPPDDHAARLIETAGLKGYRIGDASVSAKHANFIINHGRASAADLEGLIAHVQATVLAVHGVALHPEVRIVGVP
jgi:UDP-N-acetylmuramate dehydrogenase